jgi:hypothetical protein
MFTLPRLLMLSYIYSSFSPAAAPGRNDLLLNLVVCSLITFIPPWFSKRSVSRVFDENASTVFPESQWVAECNKIDGEVSFEVFQICCLSPAYRRCIKLIIVYVCFACSVSCFARQPLVFFGWTSEIVQYRTSGISKTRGASLCCSRHHYYNLETTSMFGTDQDRCTSGCSPVAVLELSHHKKNQSILIVRFRCK